MKPTKVIQSKLSRRYNSANSLSSGMSFKCLIPVLILLTVFIVGANNQPVDTESVDALFIDEKGNVGIGTNQPTSTLDVKGDILGIGMVPPGGIVMFSGDIEPFFDKKGTGIKGTDYEGWQLCNGNNGAPDLRDRFIAAAGGNYKIGRKEGADRITLSVDQLPAHTHAGKTAAAGIHQHWIEGTNASGLAKRKRNIPGQTTVDMGFGGGRNADPDNVRWRGSVNTDSLGNHVHRFTTGPTGKAQPIDIRPSFYALAFIMRLPPSQEG